MIQISYKDYKIKEKSLKPTIEKYKQITYPLNVYAFLTYYETGEFRELHYGLFSDSYDDIATAQKASTDLLFKHLYKTPAKLLEVGIGFGKTHQKLIDKGFECTGITPDAAQIDIVNEKVEGANLVCTRFEDFNPKKTDFNIILFQESAQYILEKDLFDKAFQLLAPDGRILIVDEFSIVGDVLHNLDKFIATAQKNGFILSQKQNLSIEAAPTVDYILNSIASYSEQICSELELEKKQLPNLINALYHYKNKYYEKEFLYCFLEFKKEEDKPQLVHGNLMKLQGLGLPPNLNLNYDFEPKETQLIQALIKQDDIVVDIGANIGYYTLQFAKLTGNTGHVYAFEPENRNYNLLKEHISLNHYENVTLINKGVSSHTQSGKLFINDDNIGMHRAYPSLFNTQKFINIDLVDLDSFLGNKKKVDFIKIDIEGYEYNAFLGMPKILQYNKQLKIMIEFSPVALWESGTDPVNFIDLIGDYGYKIYSIDKELEIVKTASLKKELIKATNTIKSCLNNNEIKPNEAEAYFFKRMDENNFTCCEVQNFLLLNPKYFDINILKRKLNYIQKRVLILVKGSVKSVGGIEIVIRQLIDLFNDYNWNVDVKSNNDILVNDRLKNFQTYDPLLYDYFVLSSKINWKEYDLVVTNNYMCGTIYPTETTKVVTLVHGVFTSIIDNATDDDLSTLNTLVNLESAKTIEEITYRNKSKLISVSKQVQNELENCFGLTSNLINNGFDFNSFSQPDNSFRKEHGIPLDKIVALYAGRWSTIEKRPDITLEMSKNFPDVVWIFATNMKLQESELMNNIIVLENIPYAKMPELYAIADFTVQLSLYEGFSNFAMESIASKTPMISTRTGIIDEVYSGCKLEELLIEQSFDRDIILEEAMKKVYLLLSNYDTYKKTSEILWIYAKEKFSLEKWKIEMTKALNLKNYDT